MKDDGARRVAERRHHVIVWVDTHDRVLPPRRFLMLAGRTHNSPTALASLTTVTAHGLTPLTRQTRLTPIEKTTLSGKSSATRFGSVVPAGKDEGRIEWLATRRRDVRLKSFARSATRWA